MFIFRPFIPRLSFHECTAEYFKCSFYYFHFKIQSIPESAALFSSKSMFTSGLMGLLIKYCTKTGLFVCCGWLRPRETYAQRDMCTHAGSETHILQDAGGLANHGTDVKVGTCMLEWEPKSLNAKNDGILPSRWLLTHSHPCVVVVKLLWSVWVDLV